MSRDDHAHLYHAVPVLVWPWLWWQLFRLRLWVAATGRDVLCGVDRWGNLRVHLVGDDPGRWTPSAHPHLHQYYLTDELADETRLQWRARIAAVFCEGFGVQDWVIFPRRSGEACGAEGDEVRAKIRDPVVLCDALTPCGRRITKQVPYRPFGPHMSQAQGCTLLPQIPAQAGIHGPLPPQGLAGREGLDFGPALRRCAPAGRSRFRDSAMRCA